MFEGVECLLLGDGNDDNVTDRLVQLAGESRLGG